jgi:hypothetical protein
MKLTLLSLIIKYFRKYKFIRKILLFFNWIILSLFGISIIDIYDSNFVLYLIESIRSSHLYKVLIEILENKVDNIENKVDNIENKVKIIENKVEKSREFQKNTISEGSIKKANGIQKEINWSNRQINRNIVEEINNNPESLRKEYIPTENQLEDNNDKINYKRYFLIGSIIILSGLTWFFWDDIKPFLNLNYFKKRKPDNSSPSDNTNNSIPDIKDYNEEYSKYFKEIEVNEELYDLEQIRSQNESKPVDYSDVEIEKWTDSPTTPKASSSKLPSKLTSNEKIMIPITKEK